jgi:hypothetical protein
MMHAMLRTTEDILSGILNLVCPECGGRMGGRRKEFKCQGACQTDWREAWESSHVAKPRNSTNEPSFSASSTPQGYERIDFRLDAGIPGITRSNIYLPSPPGQEPIDFRRFLPPARLKAAQ